MEYFKRNIKDFAIGKSNDLFLLMLFCEGYNILCLSITIYNFNTLLSFLYFLSRDLRRMNQHLYNFLYSPGVGLEPRSSNSGFILVLYRLIIKFTKISKEFPLKFLQFDLTSIE